MLDFHQGETCEGIIQHLEMREGVKRGDVQVRDIGNNTPRDARVEMTFRLTATMKTMREEDTCR
jgi:hypothetical protein